VGDRIDSKSPITLTTDSIHQALLEDLLTLDVCSGELPQANTNPAIVSATASIHQTPNEKLGVCSGDCDRPDTNAGCTTAAESMHQAPAVQGGSGLVYSFWKGESIVNHYRYKVKINGKWKVKSIHIPVGKLPKVREAIANQLGVAAIVIEVLGKQF
jgi:hypothetical protein